MTDHRLGPGSKVLAAGRPHTLGARVAQGGEGTVYEIVERPNSLMKLYLNPVDAALAYKLNVITEMAKPALFNIAAWPEFVVTSGKTALGFTMPAVRNAVSLMSFTTPADRMQRFPQVNYGTLVGVASNLARAVATVHGQDIVIGDLNGNNVLVLANGRVVLIDVDSFQVGTHKNLRCRVGMVDLTPPELQGQNLSSVRRTVDHDLFALAVLIFEIICLGRHPFAGAPGMELHQAIASGCHAFAKKPSMALAGIGLKAPSLLSPVLIETFQRAFAAPGWIIGRSRPSALEWVSVLDAFQASLRSCAHNVVHVHPPYADKRKGCPWCFLESEARPSFFAPSSRRPRPVTEPTLLQRLFGA